MSNIIGTVYKSDSKTEYTTDTYLHLNDVVLLVHHWVGETDDGYMDEWSISHGMLSGEKDLSIILKEKFATRLSKGDFGGMGVIGITHAL